MSFKSTPAACYVVTWDAAGITKAGYSSTQRWRTFEARGARLVFLRFFTSTPRALGLEDALLAHLRSVADLAFDSADAAIPFLGARGAGWCECYRTACDPHMREQCVRIADAYCEGSALLHARTDARTNALTEKHSTTSDDSTLATPAGGHKESLRFAADFAVGGSV